MTSGRDRRRQLSVTGRRELRRRPAGQIDAEAIRDRGFRLVLNYGNSAASLIVPTLIAELGVELVGLNAFSRHRRRQAQLRSGGRPGGHQAAGRGRGRRPGRHDGRRGGADLAGRRAGPGARRRGDAAAAPARDLGQSEQGDAAGADHRDQPRGRDRERRRRPGGEDQGLAVGAAGRSREGRRAVRRGVARRLRVPRLPPGLRRRDVDLQGAGADRPLRPLAVGAGRRAAGRARSRTRSSTARGTARAR